MHLSRLARTVLVTGWTGHRRVHQYRGGHVESHGGVRINIDRNWLDLGGGSRIGRQPAHCGGAATYDFARYAARAVGSRGALVRTVQCLLTGKGRYSGAVDGKYDAGLGTAVRKYRVSRGLAAGAATTVHTWVALLADGTNPALKYGSASIAVRRVQRALNAADAAGLSVTGVFTAATTTAVKRYQRAHGLSATGVVAAPTWRALEAGRA